MNKPENPPAFPGTQVMRQDGEVIQHAEYGMTLRDYFAAKAMDALIHAKNTVQNDDLVKSISKGAYLVADAMIEERKGS